MVEPASVATLVGLILKVVQLIASSASTARQNKRKCLALSDRANTLANVLPNSTYAAAVNDMEIARVLHKLKAALDEAVVIIESCQTGSVFTRDRRAAELDAVNGRINDCITDLTFIRDARTHNGTAPAQTSTHGSYYYQAQGGAASSGYVVHGYPAPHYATVNASSSGYSNLSSYFTLPTVRKFMDRVFH